MNENKYYCRKCYNQITIEYTGNDEAMNNKMLCSDCNLWQYPFNEYSYQNQLKAIEYQKKIKAIVLALGEPWHYSERNNANDEYEISYYHAYVDNTNSLQALSINLNNHKNHLHISGVFPTSKISNDFYIPWEVREGISIYASFEKSEKAIANDIVKRLLPKYQKYFAIAEKQMIDSDDYHILSESNKLELAKIANCKIDKNREHSISFYHNKKPYAAIRVSGNSVKMEIDNLNMAQAKQILQIIKA